MTSKQVEESLTALRVLSGWTQEDRDFNKLLAEVRLVALKAIDTITFLSDTKLITGTFKDGTLHLVIPVGVKVEVKDFDGDEYITRTWESKD